MAKHQKKHKDTSNDPIQGVGINLEDGIAGFPGVKIPVDENTSKKLVDIMNEKIKKGDIVWDAQLVDPSGGVTLDESFKEAFKVSLENTTESITHDGAHRWQNPPLQPNTVFLNPQQLEDVQKFADNEVPPQPSGEQLPSANFPDGSPVTQEDVDAGRQVTVADIYGTNPDTNPFLQPLITTPEQIQALADEAGENPPFSLYVGSNVSGVMAPMLLSDTSGVIPIYNPLLNISVDKPGEGFLGEPLNVPSMTAIYSGLGIPQKFTSGADSEEAPPQDDPGVVVYLPPPHTLITVKAVPGEPVKNNGAAFGGQANNPVKSSPGRNIHKARPDKDVKNV